MRRWESGRGVKREPRTLISTTKHNGEPAKFKVTVLSQHKDPMSRVIQEAMNIKNHQDKGLECLNSKAEYRQAPIVRTKKNVTVGL